MMQVTVEEIIQFYGVAMIEIKLLEKRVNQLEMKLNEIKDATSGDKNKNKVEGIDD